MSIKIFIVDDSVVARKMLIRILSEADMDVEIVGEASTGQGAIIMLDEAMPDIVMLEAQLSGGMKAVDVIREIKALSADTKVILCADSRTTQVVISASKVGADDFIEKPYNKTRVMRTVHDLMGKEI